MRVYIWRHNAVAGAQRAPAGGQKCVLAELFVTPVKFFVSTCKNKEKDANVTPYWPQQSVTRKQNN